jgi:hypothetical protein
MHSSSQEGQNSPATAKLALKLTAARHKFVGMNESICVCFKAETRQGTQVELFCKRCDDAMWPPSGRGYANWKQLLGTMSEILGVPEESLDILRAPGRALENRPVTTQQLKLFGFPNLDMTSTHPSYQSIDI